LEKLLRLYPLMLLSNHLPGRTVTWVGGGELEISCEEGSTVRLFVNEQTGMPAKIQYPSASMNGPPATIVEKYEAFAEVNGIQFPSRMTITQDGRKYADIVVESTKVNTGLKAEDLS